MNLSPMLLCDYYKIAHREQYPHGTEHVYSTWTPRTSRVDGINEVVAFKFQAFILWLNDYFQENFFSQDLGSIVVDYKRFIKNTLGVEDPDSTHIEALHRLGYLPLVMSAVPEGTLVPIGVPMMTIENTHPEFYWLTNYIETLASTELWQAMTSATIAHEYNKLLTKYALETVGNSEFVKFQGHDFSMRGMTSLESCQGSGAGHLLSFVGTDTIPAIHFAEKYYDANIEKELIGTSIPATEHSVMCSYGQNELVSYRHLITEVYQKGYVSIVSDTWDFWNVLNNVIKTLKPEIMARDGKVVIRPDSGDPVLIVCGDPNGKTEDERKGAIEILWEIFGGTTNKLGFKELDSHIGCIYGDAITLSRAGEICQRLKEKGFASTNIVFGIGSYTYQYVTRDTFGFAWKATHVVINGDEKMIFKDPKTDHSGKKSQRGKCAVFRDETGKLVCFDGLDNKHYSLIEKNMLQPIFKDGNLVTRYSFADVRKNLAEEFSLRMI